MFFVAKAGANKIIIKKKWIVKKPRHGSVQKNDEVVAFYSKNLSSTRPSFTGSRKVATFDSNKEDYFKMIILSGHGEYIKIIESK